MKSLALALITLTSLTGCVTSASTTPRPAQYFEPANTTTAIASLFSNDANTLSDEAIQRILAYRYEPPALSRIALIPFGRETWSSWSEELAVASESMQQQVLARLRAAPQIFDASYLPSILIPKNRSVPHLREAAARYQADLLLVYRSYCHSFERYRLFRQDESRAYCGVEAVLLDTRTGLVRFTAVATQTFDVTQNKTDTNFRETQLRAQLEATANAMADISTKITGFLGSKT